eukprot:TRINITY_DN43659_c0_g1_i3.p1 TRINITY_DN43659_c0_g1~~TRINITY_DN43659_c0_g1_i3.p1  ORF type:complete len:325 (+),score=82.42 TRINITY_DN43659_c0_g1_i3:209-1183(+)
MAMLMVKAVRSMGLRTPVSMTQGRAMSVATDTDLVHEGRKVLRSAGLVVAGLVVGGAAGVYWGKEWGLSIAKKKAGVGYQNYSNTLAARLDKDVGQDDIQALLKDETVKGAFSVKEIKMLWSVLPKWDLSLWDFKDALTRMETAKLHYKVPGTVNKAMDKVGKPRIMKQGREEWHQPQKISDAAALRIFRMFDLDNNGKVNANEIITVLAIFSEGDPDAKAGLLFDVWDYDGDGEISRKQMRESYKKLKTGGSTTMGTFFTSVFFNICDQDKRGIVSRQQFIDKYGSGKMDTLLKLMGDEHYAKFLNREDFPEMARCFREAYAK